MEKQNFSSKKIPKVQNDPLPKKYWNSYSIDDEFQKLYTKLSGIDGINKQPSKSASSDKFLLNIFYSLKLIFVEKEIVLFAVLQWVSIALLYYLWISGMGFLFATNKTIGTYATSMLMVLWSLLCVWIAAYPIGIFTACMGAVHFIRQQGRSSTIAECFKMIFPQALSFWVFSAEDAKITALRIIGRIPYDDRQFVAKKISNEFLYYGWKAATVGIMPALIAGSGLVEATKESLNFVRNHKKDIIFLRAGYSVLCWIVGIAAYIAALIILINHGKDPYVLFLIGPLALLYKYTIIPIVAAAAAVTVFIRPFYVIASCNIYSEYMSERNIPLVLPGKLSARKNALVVFCVFIVLAFTVYIYISKFGGNKIFSFLTPVLNIYKRMYNIDF